MICTEQLTYREWDLREQRRHIDNDADADTDADTDADITAAAVVDVVNVIVTAAAVVVYEKKLKANSFAEIYINKQTTDEFCAAQSVKDIHSHCLHWRNTALTYTVTEQLQLQVCNIN